jgi:hypothetical protein
VIDLNDELKQRLSLPQEQPPLSASGTPPADDAEAQMRRALGLFGDAARTRPDGERQEPAQRAGGGGFMQGVHRRRFVQDGEVPVTVVRSPDAAAGPTSSRLQRVEAALTAETAARDRAERALHDAQAALQALQTKIGHNELAKDEAVAGSKRDREELITLREELAGGAGQLREIEARAHEAESELRTLRAELSEERRARKLAERLLAETSAEPVVPEAAPVRRMGEELERVPARRGRPPLVRTEPEVEQEPVKWWLAPVKAAIKRR